MVNVYLSKSGMALSKTTLIDNFKKADNVKKADYIKKIVSSEFTIKNPS